MTTMTDNNSRAMVALKMITTLTTEKHDLLKRYWQASPYERPDIQSRIEQIEVDLAYAQEERRRARAGAPPAPGHYDPLGPVHLSGNRNSNSSRSRNWKQTVEAIRTEYKGGEGTSKEELAEKYGLTSQQIHRVLGEATDQAHPTAKLNEQQVRDILNRYQESNGRRGIIKELAENFQVRKSTICDIIARRTWRNIDVEITVPRKHTAGRARGRKSS